MRRILGSILTLSLALAVPSFAANSNLKVIVKNQSGAPLYGANVAAMHFNDGKPDPRLTVIGLTDSLGELYFDDSGSFTPGVTSSLTAGNYYQIVASSQGFLPSFVQQFRNPPGVNATAATSTSPVVVNIVISSAGVSGLGKISVPVINASSGTIIFGQISLKTGGGAVAYGVTNIDNTTAQGQFDFLNVTTAPANTYQVNTFDPLLNRSAGVTISAAGAPVITVAPALDFSNAPPPVANIGQAQSAGSGGGLSVYGVVRDTNAAAIPYMQLNFQSQRQDQYGQNINDWRGAQTDENGVFQLYNLNAGSTYYASIYGGCVPNNSGACYQGYQSTASPNGAPAANDFLYPSSSTVLHPTITLQQLAPGSGTMAVYIKDQSGKPFFQAGVGLFPDGMPHQVSGTPSCSGPYIPNPGFKNTNTQAATGYALLTGLPSGNYQLFAWTPYGQSEFNAGADGTKTYNSCTTGSDDLRLTVDTTTPSAMVYVYDQFGQLVSSGTSTVDLTVKVPTGTLTGRIQGTLTFPSAVDLSASPVSIVLYPQCQDNSQPCTGGNFDGFSSASTGPVINYSIPVSSGKAYFMQVVSDYWGAVFPGGNQPQPNLSQSSVAVVNMKFFPAGRITGYMRKPDGSIFVPPSGNGAGGGPPAVNAEGKNSWGYSQLSTDGSFSVGGLLPGEYTLAARSNGNSQFPYTAKVPAPRLTISANQSITQDLYLTDAVTVVPVISVSSLPALTVVKCPNNFQGECPPEDWRAYALPQGTPFTPELVSGLLGGGPSDTPGLFTYWPSTGQANGAGCSGEFLAQPSFCSHAVPASKTGSAFDFYLLRMGGFDSANLASAARPNFVIEMSTKNIIVGSTYANATAHANGSTTTVQNVGLYPATSLSGLSQARLSGKVTATNMINQRQFGELAGNFDAFLKYLPLVWAYDSSGTLKGVGLVVPSPPVLAANNKQLENNLDKAVADGNFSTFQTLTGPAPSGWGDLGYDIRGLTAGQFYNLVVTTPNYPPFKTSVTLGVANSTTTLDVDLDLHPGVTMSGVVKDTSSVAINGAQVTVKAPGYKATTLVTDSAGAWSLSGLGSGRYNVQATAAGYALGSQDADVNSSAVTVPTFNLRAVNASITGTVYTNNPICPAGATCSAFGKTVLQGITVLAYDDTQNLNTPTAALPLFRAVTDTSGTYKITGLSTALISATTNYHQFKVFANAPGYYVLNQSTEVRPGGAAGFDFNLSPKPLDVNVFGHQVGTNYSFQITNYKDFSDGSGFISTYSYSGSLVLGTPNTSTVTFTERPDASGDTQLFVDIPLSTLSSGVKYYLHLQAQPNDPSAAVVIKEVEFGKDLPHGVCQSVDQALIGDETGVNAQGLPNNSLPLDISGGAGGNGSAMSMPTGGVIPTLSTAIPTMCMTETDASASSLVTSSLHTSGLTLAAFLSGVYSVSLTSVNYTAKGLDLTLSYDQTGADLNDMAAYSYNSTTQKWDLVPGLQTIDPVKGTISVKGLKSLASVLTVRSGPGVAAIGGGNVGMLAVSDGQGYRPNARTSAATDTGQFAVLKPSQVNGGTFTGANIRIYNFPNPFDLQSKTLSLPATANCSGGSSILTNGTVIKYEIPGGISGHAVIRIYTLAGRLVQEIDAGTVAPNKCYAIEWDGKNRNGQPVANGVYYGLLSVGGSKQSSGTFKLAVIK